MLEISRLEELKDLIGEVVYAEPQGIARRRWDGSLIKFTIVKVERCCIELQTCLYKYTYIPECGFDRNGKTLVLRGHPSEYYKVYRSKGDYQLAKQRNELADGLHAKYFGSYQNGLRSCSLEDLAIIKDILDRGNQ